MNIRHNIGPVRLTWEHNPSGVGWRLTVSPFGKGCGYRALDWPWYSHDRAAPFWRSWALLAYLPGVTFVLATNQHHVLRRNRRRLVVGVARGCRGVYNYVPNWW